MKRVLWLFLTLSIFSLQAQEEELVLPEGTSTELVEPKEESLVAANEFGSFKEKESGFSQDLLTKQEDLSLPVKNIEKNRLYVLAPIGGLGRSFFLPGLSFRRDLNGSFFELSYLGRKYKTLLPAARNEAEDALGLGLLGRFVTVYGNTFNAFYGIRSSTRFVQPYISFGGGLLLSYFRYQDNSHISSWSTVSTALGLGFKESGFVDLTLDYPISISKPWRYPILGLRLGVGFPF